MEEEVEVVGVVDEDEELPDWPTPWVLLLACPTPVVPVALLLDE